MKPSGAIARGRGIRRIAESNVPRALRNASTSGERHARPDIRTRQADRFRDSGRCRTPCAAAHRPSRCHAAGCSARSRGKFALRRCRSLSGDGRNRSRAGSRQRTRTTTMPTISIPEQPGSARRNSSAAQSADGAKQAHAAAHAAITRKTSLALDNPVLHGRHDNSCRSWRIHCQAAHLLIG